MLELDGYRVLGLTKPVSDSDILTNSNILVWAAASFGWVCLGNPNPHEHVEDIYRIMIYWGIVLIIHTIIFLITRKDTIRGIRKDDIF